MSNTCVLGPIGPTIVGGVLIELDVDGVIVVVGSELGVSDDDGSEDAGVGALGLKFDDADGVGGSGDGWMMFQIQNERCGVARCDGIGGTGAG